ncbi:MAG: hypothetical protein HYX92_10835 [Chloroflexi bacterium]|nr:hypothetical protein [Chloroflexota bacterium]
MPTTVNEIEILDPRGRVKSAKYDLAPRPRSLEGLSIGFLDNGKSNADVILERLQEILTSRYKFANVLSKPRRRPGEKWQYRKVGEKDEVIDEMVSKADIVVNGVGD